MTVRVSKSLLLASPAGSAALDESRKDDFLKDVALENQKKRYKRRGRRDMMR